MATWYERLRSKQSTTTPKLAENADPTILLERLEKVKATGNHRWSACCPAHQDKSPSLSIKDDGDKILVHCFAGCDTEDVLAAVGLSWRDIYAPLDDGQKADRAAQKASRAWKKQLDRAKSVAMIGRDSPRPMSKEDWESVSQAQKLLETYDPTYEIPNSLETLLTGESPTPEVPENVVPLLLKEDSDSLTKFEKRVDEDLKLLLADDDEAFQEIISQEWLYDDAIPCASVGMAYGPSGTGKSYVMLDFGMCLASGRPWQGFEHGSGERQQVIYISAEGGRGMRIRKRAWEEKHQDKVPELRILPKAYMLNEKEDLLTIQSLLRKWVAHTGQDIAAVVVDTLAQSNSGEENSSKDATALTRACTELAMEFKSAVVLVHHTGKDTERGSRGSSAFKGNIEFEISLEGDTKTTVRMECKKQKDTEQFEPVSICFDVVEIPGAVDYKGRPVKNLVARQASMMDAVRKACDFNKNEQAVIDICKEMGPGLHLKSKIQTAFFLHKDVATLKNEGTKRATLHKAIQSLKDKGFLIEEDKHIALELPEE